MRISIEKVWLVSTSGKSTIQNCALTFLTIFFCCCSVSFSSSQSPLSIEVPFIKIVQSCGDDYGPWLRRTDAIAGQWPFQNSATVLQNSFNERPAHKDDKGKYAGFVLCLQLMFSSSLQLDLLRMVYMVQIWSVRIVFNYFRPSIR